MPIVMNRLCLLLIFILIAFGCSSTPPPNLSLTHEKSIRTNDEAHSAYIKGDYLKALNLYEKALKISRSVEDLDGIAINLINIAVTHRKLENFDKAHLAVDGILNPEYGGYSNILRSEATYIKALLFTDKKEAEMADSILASGLILCQKSRCKNEGKIYNLKSRIALIKSEPIVAEEMAKEGLAINKKSGNLKEVANSFRLIGDAALMQKDINKARTNYKEALKLDKNLGLSRKIVQDLIGLGDSLFVEENVIFAKQFYKRALVVNKNGVGSEVLKGKIVEKIRHCEEKSPFGK